MGTSPSRSWNPEIISNSGRHHSSEITSKPGRYQYPKLPYTRTSPVLLAKNKGPLYDPHLAHTAYMNNVAKVRRSSRTPHSSQLLKQQHLLRRRSPDSSMKAKKNTSPVRYILKSPKRVTKKLINYENMDLLGFDHDAANDENFNFVEESTSESRANANVHHVCDISDEASSGCNTYRSNKADNNLGRQLGTPSEAQQKYSVQALNQQLEPTFPMPPNLEAVSCNNYNRVGNNGDLRLGYQNNATQTSRSPSRISNHSSNSYDDSEVMKSVTFPRETAIFYMMHNEEVSQGFSAKKRHDFCRNYPTPQENSQPSITAHDYRSFQKRRQSKYIALESEKEFRYPWKRRVYISETHYQEAEKPLIDGVIKEESAEQMEDRRKLQIGDGADGAIDTETCYSAEKRRYALENTSLDRNDIQGDIENHDREFNHSEHCNSDLQDELQIIKILSRQEMVSSDYSGYASWNSYEYQSKEMENNMRGKSEDGKSSAIATPRKVSELHIPLDKVLRGQHLRYRRNRLTGVRPNAALTKFHAHGDGFLPPQHYLAHTLCCKQEEKLTELLASNRESTIPRHRSRHESSSPLGPICPPSTPCSGVCATEEMQNSMVYAELNEVSSLLAGCVVRRHRKPTSAPCTKNQEETIGDAHSNKTVTPQITTDTDDNFNDYIDVKHASSLQMHPLLRNDDQDSLKYLLYEEANKIQSDASNSDDEHKQNTSKSQRRNLAIMEGSPEQTPPNKRSPAIPTRRPIKEARIRTGSLAFNASESDESANAKLIQKSTESRNKNISNKGRAEKESNCRHLLVSEPHPTCQTPEENTISLYKHESSQMENEISCRHLLTDEPQRKCKTSEETITYLHKHKSSQMQNGCTCRHLLTVEAQRKCKTPEESIIYLHHKHKSSQSEGNCRNLLKDGPQAKCETPAEHTTSLHKHETTENENKMIPIPDTQDVVNQYDTEKSRGKHDKITNACCNQHANSNTPFLTELQHQNATHNETPMNSALNNKDRAHSTTLECSEQLSHLDKSIRESSQCNINSQSRNLQHGEHHHQQLLVSESPRRENSAYHCRMMRARTIGDPSNFCSPSSQSVQTVVDKNCSLHQNKDYQPARDPQHQSFGHQESERDSKEGIFPQQLHISRNRYCPVHRQQMQEDDCIPSLDSLNSDEYHLRCHHFQLQQHYCRIHHRMFTINVLPREHLVPENVRTMSERNEDPCPGMPSPVAENQPYISKRDLSTLGPRCRSLVAMFERRKHVLLSGRNWKDEQEDISAAMNGVNGVNGHHGELNGGGDLINNGKGCWTIGLINSKFRYLTAETFGFKINANGASLKKKQVWTLEPAAGDSAILLRSHLDKYLAVDTFGNVTCESEERDDPGTKFQISVADDSTGRWALRNITRGYFLGASSDKLTCTAKVPGDAELWHVHLAARPQVNLRSVGRKRFAHLSENLDEIHVDANIPWGEDTLFTLEFRADDNGKYALHTCNNKYLSREGKLVDTCTPNCLFSAEYHAGQLALRDRTGAYLSPIGSKAVLKSRSTTVTKDELFSLEDSLPQASFVAGLNSRYVSVKQGVDVTANQDEISDHETFQLEFDSSTKRWYIRTMQDRYWTLETGGGIQASGDKRSSNALFDLVWQGDGSVSFRANNGKFVSTKRSGHLYANCDNVEDNSKYFFYLINRPILVLKCEQGFVGYKSASSPKLECNKATYETIQVERSEKGVVFFKGQNGKYWHVDGESVTADTDVPEGFFIELRDPTHICIKSTSGEYLVASKNGAFRLGDSDYENATKWEY